MNVIEPGHIYDLNTLDGDGKPQRLVFVNREDGDEHPGTQTQEVLRMEIDMLSVLIDRTNHCDACMRWEGNDRIIKAMSEAQRQMRLAIVFHEQRVLERKFAKGHMEPEHQPIAADGHFKLPDTTVKPPTAAEKQEFWRDMNAKEELRDADAQVRPLIPTRDLRIVVNGHAAMSHEAPVNMKMGELKMHAIRADGYASGHNRSEWTMHSENGTLVPEDTRVDKAVLPNNKLFISMPAGVGA